MGKSISSMHYFSLILLVVFLTSIVFITNKRLDNLEYMTQDKTSEMEFSKEDFIKKQLEMALKKAENLQEFVDIGNDFEETTLLNRRDVSEIQELVRNSWLQKQKAINKQKIMYLKEIKETKKTKSEQITEIRTIDEQEVNYIINRVYPISLSNDKQIILDNSFEETKGSGYMWEELKSFGELHNYMVETYRTCRVKYGQKVFHCRSYILDIAKLSGASIEDIKIVFNDIKKISDNVSIHFDLAKEKMTHYELTWNQLKKLSPTHDFLVTHYRNCRRYPIHGDTMTTCRIYAIKLAEINNIPTSEVGVAMQDMISVSKNMDTIE